MSKATELIERQISELAEAGRKERKRRDDDGKRLEGLRQQVKAFEGRIERSEKRAEERENTIAELERDLEVLRSAASSGIAFHQQQHPMGPGGIPFWATRSNVPSTVRPVTDTTVINYRPSRFGFYTVPAADVESFVFLPLQGDAKYPAISFRIKKSKLNKGSKTYRMIADAELAADGCNPLETDIYWSNPHGETYWLVVTGTVRY